MNILGISAFYHDSAACLVRDGQIVAAAQEERFTRIKHDAALPARAMSYCLAAGGVGANGIDAVAFYDKPLTKFSRLMKTYLAIAPAGITSFRHAMPSWAREKLWIPYQIERGLRTLGYKAPKTIHFVEHHESHAASAFYPSPFDSATILTMDGVGEWATSSIAVGKKHELTMLRQLMFPHSLGLLYSAFTYFCGFKINSGEYKLMGLAPYGEGRYVDKIMEMLDLRPDGSFRMAPKYFDYLGGVTMTSKHFAEKFGGPPRQPETPITRREMDLARSIQIVTEDIVLRMARHARAATDEPNLCLAGGVALNCVANGRLVRERIFDRIWIQPAAGDAGGAVGSALHTWHQTKQRERKPRADDGMAGSYLGPQFSDTEVRAFLDARSLPYRYVEGDDAWADAIAELLAAGNIIGVVYGRMEFGPRALGHRSILGDPRSPKMQSTMNLKTKFRESFRPFAPAVLEEHCREYFELEGDSPYMLVVAPVVGQRRVEVQPDGASAGSDDLIATVNQVRSELPAITHVDYSARIQTVSKSRSPRFHAIIDAFRKRTGCSVVINTSFNVRGEPIVCTPEDAYRCFSRTEMDYLVLEHCVLAKADQPKFEDDENWRAKYALD